MSEPTPSLPLGTLVPWLEKHVPSFDPSATPKCRLLAGGRSNLTFAITDASGQRFALRRPPLGHVMPKAHDMAREFRVLQGLNSVAFPAPRVHALCEDLDVMGVPFLLMDFVDGRVVADAADTSNLSAAEADQVSAILVGGLAALHAVDITEAGLADLGRAHGYLTRQVALWGRQWTNTKTRELTQMDRLASWLEQEVVEIPTGLPFSLVHGDYRLDNVIIDPDLKQLLAVLDWEMSTVGDPIADLAVTLVYWSEASDRLRTRIPVADGVTSGLGFWTRGRLVDEYVRLTGLDTSHLQFCVALSCYKLAVIMESIHFRGLSGQQLGAAAENQEDMGAAAEALATLGLNVVEEGALEGLAS